VLSKKSDKPPVFGRKSNKPLVKSKKSDKPPVCGKNRIKPRYWAPNFFASSFGPALMTRGCSARCASLPRAPSTTCVFGHSVVSPFLGFLVLGLLCRHTASNPITTEMYTSWAGQNRLKLSRKHFFSNLLPELNASVHLRPHTGLSGLGGRELRRVAEGRR